MNEVLGHSSSTMKSKYKYVRYYQDGFLIGRPGGSTAGMKAAAKKPWIGRPFINVGIGETCTTRGTSKRFATEREAALFVDKWFISQGREPVNILKPKQ